MPTMTEFEAISHANSSIYRLAVDAWSSDTSRALRLAEKVKAGAVWVNTYYTFPVELPLGGLKQSGIGRSNTVLALKHYLEVKGIYVEAQSEPMRPYYRLVPSE
ncbi:MAG: aldehyde dehydrogenase family protein [Candidatus Caldarchaeum sp.]